MPGFNLVRNAKLLYTSKLTGGAVDLTGHTTGTTKEVLVMNGFSFSQNTETQNVTVSEAGLDPARGQRTFNTALAPVEFSFTTYVRPDFGSVVTADESVLWNALLSDVAVDGTGTALGTVSTIQRTGSSNRVTFNIAATSLTDYRVGEVVTIQGVVDSANPTHWNAPAKIVSSTPAAVNGQLGAAVTVLVVDYLLAPGGTGSPTGLGTVKLFKGAVTNQTAGSNHLLIHTGRSNKNQLVAFGLIIAIDDVTYTIDNCSMNQASIDFGLDGIAQIAWSGQGTKLTAISGTTTLTAGAFGGTAGVTGNYTQANDAANFITNKLTTATLKSSLRGIGSGATTYTIAITGGNLTINNNINYITPEILGVVNEPIGYFTGTRAISGNVTAYLKAGSGNTGGLLTDMLNNNVSETKFAMGLQIGGSTNSIRVDVDMPGVMLQIPSVDTADVVSTTINFTAGGFDSSTSAVAGGDAVYDLEATNDLTVRYYSV